MQVKDVADELDHNLSSTYHIVNTLLARRYLARNDRGGLTIGERIGALNASMIRSSDFEGEVRRLISDLARDSGETVYLTRYIDGAVVIQIVVESQHSLRVKGLNVGYSGAEDRRASGKAVLAQLEGSELDRVVERLGIGSPGSSVEPAQLRLELAAIRDSGFAFDNEDYEPGVCCVAVPYFDSEGKVAGSVAASAPALRVERLSTVIREQVASTADLISRAMS